jgi:ribosome-associated protein
MAVLATEGEDNGEWIIVDCGAAVVHIMQPGIRDYYHLEEIWGGKPVRMKVGEVKTRLVKASEPEPVRKAAARAAAKTAGQPAARPAAKRPATRKSPAKPAGASRPAAGQTPAAKAAPARKTTPRKAAAGTTTARKTTTRKTSRAG